MSAAVKRNGRAACGAVVFGFALLLRLTVALLVMFLAFFFTLARLALAFFNFEALTGESFQRWQTMTVIRTQAGTEPIDASKPPPARPISRIAKAAVACRLRPGKRTWEDGMRRLLSAVVVGLAALAQPACAQTYPTKPIHVLIPYAPGGIADIAARIVGAKLTEAWGQQVVVENRPGGNGFIAMTAAAKAAPDGYTLVMATGGDVAINPALFKDMPYDVGRDLAPIGTVSDAPLVLAVHGAAPYKTVADVIAAAKAQPGRLSVATPGNGSINQIV